MPGHPVLNAVYQLLGMFDSQPHGKRLLPELDRVSQEHFVRVARAVARRQHQVITWYLIMIVEDGRNQTVRTADNVGKLVPEKDLKTGGFEASPYFQNDVPEPVGSDVGLTQVEDLPRGAELDQLSQYIFHVRVPDSRRQLSVRKGARSTLTELDIALRIEHPPAPERLHVLQPLIHRLAALDKGGRQTELRKPDCGKKPGRSHPHDDDFPVAADVGSGLKGLSRGPYALVFSVSNGLVHAVVADLPLDELSSVAPGLIAPDA